MAAQEPISFDTIIQADRQKKRNEDLASKLLGKNRRSSAPGSGVGKKAQNATTSASATPGSLASRIGVSKRSASANSRPRKTNNLQPPSAPARNRASPLRPGPTHNRRNNNDRLAAAINNDTTGQATVRDNSVGIAIKGTSSGPFTVVGSNFAPGTTAADIQSALEPVAGETMSCYVVSQRPAVTAEVVFAERWSAENAVANFHNQRADGRVLSMRLKSATAHPDHDVFNPPTGPRGWSQGQVQHTQSFNDLRQQADEQRRQHRRADPAVQDGSFGFNEQNKLREDRGRGYNNRRANGRQNYGGRRDNQDAQHGLYSDEMMVDAPPQNRRGRGRR